MLRLVLITFLTCACGPVTPEPANQSQPVVPPGTQPQPVAPPDIVGHWGGDWGDLWLIVDPDGTVRGVYSHDQGTVTGRLADGVFRGWWCEAPSRQPDHDAGPVEFTFTRREGGIDLDGRWRYANETEWRENWDVRWIEGWVDPAANDRFDDPSQFCTAP